MQKLERSLVRIDMPDEDTLFLRNVPSMSDCFNKSHTNLLVKRAGAGVLFLVCVDEDLEYKGRDRGLARAFTAAHKQQGWRVIFVEQGAEADFQRAVERALDCLGFDREEPILTTKEVCTQSCPQGNLLASFGKNLSEACGAELEPTVGRETEVNEVVSALLQWQPKFTIITAKSGVGKTNLLYGVARKLREPRPELQLASVDLASLFAGTMFDAERESLFSTLLNEATGSPHTVLAIEHLEIALIGQVPHANVHLANALDHGAKLIGTATSTFALDSTLLERRAQIVNLPEMDWKETEKVLLALRGQIESHHCVYLDEDLIPAIVETASPLEGFFPAKAIALLDAAAGIVVLSGQAEVRLPDIHLAAARFREDREYPTLITAEN
ncbi:MAG: hypothetical protein M3R69_12240 [Acidobacteriota bacterium]|nr:hypothetical protein [Acidobacteriota bacterium]